MKRIIIKQHTTQLYIAKSVCRERYVVLVLLLLLQQSGELVKMKLSLGLSFFGFVLLLL
jgi:hypothetical protein